MLYIPENITKHNEATHCYIFFNDYFWKLGISFPQLGEGISVEFHEKNEKMLV